MKISVAIPCYEMHGWGAEFLNYSLNILESQNYKNFEVVVSDHSLDDKIKDVCLHHKELDLVYIKNENNRGSSSANINNCIANSSGDLIKVLCQDDYLLDKDALQKTVCLFDCNKGWLVSSYYHTRNRTELISIQLPNPAITTYTNNLIGTHSCLTILNKNPLYFDENLLWYMDCEYYYRLRDKFGMPAIITEPTFVQFLWSGQVTNTMVTREVEEQERNYILNKYKGA